MILSLSISQERVMVKYQLFHLYFKKNYWYHIENNFEK